MRTPPPVLPPEGSAPEYKPSLLERGGIDAVRRVRVALIITLVFIVLVPILLAALSLRGVTGLRALIIALMGAAAGAAFTATMVIGTSELGGKGAGKIHFPSGKSTPYEEQFSYQEALEARDDIAGAAESWEAVIAERPGAVAPRMRAAEFYAGRGADPQRAAELFREIRDLPDVSARDAVYAESRLVDLYDGPLNDPGRALVELRRIIETHPGSPLAAHAREALPRLKARLLAERGETPAT